MGFPNKTNQIFTSTAQSFWGWDLIETKKTPDTEGMHPNFSGEERTRFTTKVL